MSGNNIKAVEKKYDPEKGLRHRKKGSEFENPLDPNAKKKEEELPGIEYEPPIKLSLKKQQMLRDQLAE